MIYLYFRYYAMPLKINRYFQRVAGSENILSYLLLMITWSLGGWCTTSSNHQEAEYMIKGRKQMDKKIKIENLLTLAKVFAAKGTNKIWWHWDAQECYQCESYTEFLSFVKECYSLGLRDISKSRRKMGSLSYNNTFTRKSTKNAIGTIILLIAIAFAIFAALLQVMALCNMVDKDELAAAFRFNEILALIKNLGWGRYIGILFFTVIAVMIVSVFCGFIFGVIASVISFIAGSAFVMALVNIILNSLLLNPYTSIVFSRVYGSVYREASNDKAESNEILDAS